MKRTSRVRVLLSCEHGGNHVPAGYRHLFRGQQRIVDSHRGLDIGARHVARQLQRALGGPLICATVTRLVVDLNRSAGHPRLFSEFTRGLPERERRKILGRFYRPYREIVASWIAAQIKRGDRALHISVHSFTPVLNGERRRADIGLLYDPRRPAEARFCCEWQARLTQHAPNLTVRRNYPYRGTSDSLVVALRRRFPARRYVGMELEINQKWLAGPRARGTRLARDLAATMLANRV